MNFCGVTIGVVVTDLSGVADVRQQLELDLLLTAKLVR